MARPLKCHALKRCTSWRETCLASVFALRLGTQRARAASRLRSDTCLITRLRVSMIPTLRQRRKDNRGNHSIYSSCDCVLAIVVTRTLYHKSVRFAPVFLRVFTLFSFDFRGEGYIIFAADLNFAALDFAVKKLLGHSLQGRAGIVRGLHRAAPQHFHIVPCLDAAQRIL